MTRTTARICFIGLLPLLLTGCRDDDPSGPLGGGEVWEEISVTANVGTSRLLAVDITGTRGAILGYGLDEAKAGFDPTILDFDGGLWTTATPADLPTDAAYLDLAADGDGGMVVLGWAQSGDFRTRIYDSRGAVNQRLERTGLGGWTVDGEDDFWVAGGVGGGGRAWSSTEPGVWVGDAIPLTPGAEAGIRDVDVRGTTAVAVGFDDGADVLQVLLRRTVDTGWEALSLGGGTFGVTLHSVALAESGAIFIGGIAGAGGVSPRSYLAVRGATGDWAEIVLPDAELVGAVNDILITSTGQVVIACSGEVDSGLATIFRGGPGGMARDLTPIKGELLQLAEDADGRLYAVGSRHTANGIDRALLLRRPALR